MELPLNYEENMRLLLGEEFDAYRQALQEPSYSGLRIHDGKVGALEAVCGAFCLAEVPWCKQGYYYPAALRPAKHPYYHAGLYYLQEPSAMSPAAILPIEEGDRVLDICAAPGGKTTQLGSRLKGSGVLVANDISAGRTKALLKNVELFGLTNVVVMSETPQRLAERFDGYFDKILIDAPCSGEGMFRKDGDMVKSWTDELIAFCKMQQREILSAAANMLRPGGMMLYSTCTFSVAENEGSIADFLREHPDFSLVPIKKQWGFLPGRGDLVGIEALNGAARLYPHKIKGEGHFLALLQKAGDAPATQVFSQREKTDAAAEAFLDFAAKTLPQKKWNGTFRTYGDGIYLLPHGLPRLDGLRVMRSGLLLGNFKNGRFTPSQALAMTLRQEDCPNALSFSCNDERVKRYLKGETIEADAKDWVLVCVDSFALGWAKAQNGRLKNKYAVSWRMT